VHLDAIRGGAAVIVFLAHLHFVFLPSLRKAAHPATTTTTATIAPAATHHRSGGHPDPAHQAVMVFFVLSGFLVGGSAFRTIKRQSWSWTRYMLHRVVRLWMVLIPALLLTLLLDTTALRVFAGQGTIYSAPAGQDIMQPDIAARLGASTFFGNMFFLQEILVTHLGSNHPLWSLTNEFWYYMAFPLLVFALVPRTPLVWRLASVALLGGIFWFTGWKIAIYFAIWLVGALAAILPGKILANHRRLYVLLAVVLFIVANISARYQGETSFLVDLTIGVAAFALLYTISQLREPSSRSLYRTVARFTSKISYSLYLTHGSLLIFMSALLVGRWKMLPLDGHTVVILCEVTVAALVTACAMHYLFEARTDQVRRFLEGKFRRRRIEAVAEPS
jgi:peptidoglycan/LPS O-acetylase OafA/YrhL